MKYLFTLIILGALTLVSNAQGNEVSLGQDATKSDYWLLSDTVEKSGQTIHAWVRTDDSKNAAVEYRSSKIRYIANCHTRRLAPTVAVTYAPNGSVLSNSHTDYPDMKPVVPGTMGEFFLDYLCTRYQASPDKYDEMWNELIE
jgi:hypothetical protein